MKRFFSRHRKLLLWLASDLALLLLFWALRPWRAGMETIVAAAAAFRRFLGRMWSGTRVSGMEILCALLVVFVLGYVIWTVIAVIRARGRRGRRAVSALLGAVNVGLTIYLGICWLWGVNYYVDGFQEKSGVYAQPVSVEDLTAVTEYFVRGLQETADAVPRDENGLFAVPREEILESSIHAYDQVERDFPFLAFDDTSPKAVHFSRIMSLLDFTGIYCPYTGESNVNVDSPACLLPSTAAHALAHQRGIASEQECHPGSHHLRPGGLCLLRLAFGVHLPRQRPGPGGSRRLGAGLGFPPGGGEGGPPEQQRLLEAVPGQHRPEGVQHRL